MNVNDISDILNGHKMWLNGEAGGKRADLEGANLQDADLEGADLRRARLQGASLRGANLQGANLQGASLEGADLQGADLEDARLEDAYLQGANLRSANLEGADLRSADLEGCAGNNNQIRSLFVSDVYQITYTAECLQIGCQRHKITEWWDFEDDVIDDMDDGALDWWRDNKGFIRMAIEKYPATPTGREGEK